MRKVKLNQKLMTDSLIASIVIQQAPELINRFFMKDTPLSGLALKGVGAGVTYLAGMLLKRPAVSSVGVGLVLSEILNQVIEGTVNIPGLPANINSPVPVSQQRELYPVSQLNEYIDESGIFADSYDNYEKFYN